jgi:hypothetical protein
MDHPLRVIEVESPSFPGRMDSGKAEGLGEEVIKLEFKIYLCIVDTK